jgi:hypothetical protein
MKYTIFCFTLPAGSGPVQAAETAGEPDVSTLRPRKLPPSRKGGGGGGGRPLQEAGGCLLHAPGEVTHAGEELAPPPLLEPQGCIHRGRQRPMHLLSSIEIHSRSRIHERTITLRFLGITLKVLRLEVSVWIS